MFPRLLNFHTFFLLLKHKISNFLKIKKKLIFTFFSELFQAVANTGSLIHNPWYGKKVRTSDEKQNSSCTKNKNFKTKFKPL